MTQTRHHGGARRVVFILIGLALPFLLLMLIELALRAADVAPRQPLFIENPQHPEFSLANPRVVERFFAHPGDAPNVSVETGYFRTERSPDAFRVVTMGGSSAAGFPYGYGASLAGMLEQRLRRTFPEREIEVVTTAMSAINSYSLLDFADEVLALAPDAVLIYAGHNEFVGILGVGSAYSSSQSPALTRLIMRLRKLTLYRLLEGLLAPKGSAAPAAGEDDGTLMARVAAERRIPSDSDLYARGVEQFEGNLTALLGRFGEAGVPVFVATLVSNERDQPPFISARSNDADWAAALARGDALLAQGRAGEAAALARELLDQDAADAAANYLLGRALLADGNTAEAAAAFARARDEDQLRFRAPGRFNELIREVAADQGAAVVDVQAAFRSRAPDGVIGRDLITEHLHPNVDGYFLLADAFHDALLSAGMPGPPSRAVPADRARNEIPVSAVDRLFGEYKVLKLTGHWPFTDRPSEPELAPPARLEERLAQALYRQETDWVRAHRELKAHYRGVGPREEYLRVSLILADAFPFVAAAQLDAGQALMAAGRNVQAVRYLHAATRYAPDRVEPLLALAQACIASGLDEAARQALARAERLKPGDPAVARLRAELAEGPPN